MLAARSSGKHSEKLVSTLLRYGATVNSVCPKEQVWCWCFAVARAAQHGVHSCPHFCVGVHACVLQGGSTALHYAVASANHRKVKLLVQAGAAVAQEDAVP